ncbi:hypothetical protein LPTSP2_01640 [Leptospira ellinghausenii]|uniref:Uncharacterized protein n=1 Tax=Leptospira ellinghausenii TaxID=1917822 RepID=A0A2P2D8F9_9LEPT|nr:hypothetical protein LPTSP2_01640 [Leptospira ellinghausenii]
MGEGKSIDRAEIGIQIVMGPIKGFILCSIEKSIRIKDHWISFKDSFLSYEYNPLSNRFKKFLIFGTPYCCLGM